MTFDETKHRRAPKGTHEGGEFSAGAWRTIDENDFDDLGDLSDDELDALRKEFMSKDIPADDQPVIESYTLGGYSDLNKHLRGVQQMDPASKGYSSYSPNEFMAVLDPVIESSVTDKNISVFRGVGSDFGRQVQSLKPGDRIIDDGYTSASLNRTVASRITRRDQTGGSAVMKVLVPKGSNVFVPGRHSGYVGEDEAIIARGGTYRFIKKSGDNYVFLYEQTKSA